MRFFVSLRMTMMGLLLLPVTLWAQKDTTETQLRGVEIHQNSMGQKGMGVESKDIIGKGELLRAACCTLGESFTNNASVDVNYSDAATGARQIKLLGLSGTYVQMMTENIPNYRMAATPFALGYVPGPWMQSIQVSKGAASVKNGFESLTGQINIEYLKPQGTDHIDGQAYLDSHLKYSLDVTGSKHLTGNNKWSTATLLHWDDRQMDEDGNGDGFMDDPKARQLNLQHRWAYVGNNYIMQAEVDALWDRMISGQTKELEARPLYRIERETQRYGFRLKNGYVFNHEKQGSVALMLSGNLHRVDNTFGHNYLNINEGELYASLMYEEDYTEHHSLSTGLSMQYDHHNDYLTLQTTLCTVESTPGAYAQYTYHGGDKLTAMAGIRVDHSNLSGTFVTPRAHVRYQPVSWFTLRASVGKGYRNEHLYPEYQHLMMAGMNLLSIYNKKVMRNEAWNTGGSMQFDIPLGDQKLQLNADYYYTRFLKQCVVDMDHKGDTRTILFYALDGKSFSHCLQLEGTIPLTCGLTVTAAWRLNRVRTTYQDGKLRETPLTSRYKGLLSLSYTPGLGLWQFDVTASLNGPGRLPDGAFGKEHSEFKAYPQLQAQVTRKFRHFDIYLGGENLTNYKQKHPIIGGKTAWDGYDATNIYAPITGAMGYIGVRVNFEKL